MYHEPIIRIPPEDDMTRKLKAGRKTARCKKHPKYQAKRYPTSECPECLVLWNARPR